MTRHAVDLLSFVSGLFVLSLGLLLLSGGLNRVPLEWVGPAVAIGLGAVIVAAARPARPEPDLSVEPSVVGQPEPNAGK